MEKLSILVVEDDPLARKVMDAHLSGHSVEYASSKESALQKIHSASPDLCFIDLKLEKDDDYLGLELLPITKAKGIYSVVMSGHDSEAVVERAYGSGCDDFYAKG